jgi:hypothetical protein
LWHSLLAGLAHEFCWGIFMWIFVVPIHSFPSSQLAGVIWGVGLINNIVGLTSLLFA